jgi:glycosyltransferase involved in cell wall biosynthesis
MTSPFFSIITPVFNGANTIHVALDSVLNQSFKDYEIIIVDDGSTDNTKEVVTTIGDSRVKYQWQSNAGPSSARNNGASFAVGQYFIFLDSDDRLSEKYLETFYSLLFPGKFLLGLSTAHFIGPNKKTLRRTIPWNNGKTFGPVLCGSYVISRTLFQSVNGFDVNLFFSENSDLFLRIRLEKKFEANSIVLNKSDEVRITTIGRQERAKKYSKKKYVSVQYFIQKHKTFFDHSLKDFINFKRIHALCALQNGDFKEARRCLAEIIKRKPNSFKTYFQYLMFLFPNVARIYYGR